MNPTRVARNVRIRIGLFSGDLSKGLCVAAQRFVSQMACGIQASESVLLTEIGRTLEEDIPLRKTEYRLSRNLQRPELEDTVQTNLLRMAANRVGQDTLLIVDPSDLSKKYAKKMEYLATGARTIWPRTIGRFTSLGAHLKRWSIEEIIRYAKTCYDLENVRVLNYQGLQNLMPLVLAAMLFVACVLDQDARLRVMASFVEKAAKWLFGIADFKYYALADGLCALLTRHPGPPLPPPPCPTTTQMNLFAYNSS